MKTTMLCRSIKGRRTGMPDTAATVTKTIAPNIQGSGNFITAKIKPPRVPIVIAIITCVNLLFLITVNRLEFNMKVLCFG
jgi:hypothetical protein